MNSSSKVFDIKTGKIYAYIMPGFLLFAFAIIVPFFICVYISLTSWRGGPVMEFIGLQNYKTLLVDKLFWESFLHNLQFIGTLLISQIGLAFLFAMVIQSKLIKFKELQKKLIFLPSILAPFVIGLIWQIVYNADYGLIAGVMKVVGLGEHLVPWLDDPDLIIFSISIVLTWQYVGQFVIIILAGIQNINPSVIEAAQVDGANAIQNSLYIVLPQLKGTMSVLVMICISGVMKMFALVFAISGGGPGTASQITALYAFNTAFKVHKLGYSSAIAVGMVILSLALIVFFRSVMSLLGGKDD